MLRLYEDGRLGDSNGQVYAIAADVGQTSGGEVDFCLPAS